MKKAKRERSVYSKGEKIIKGQGEVRSFFSVWLARPEWEWAGVLSQCKEQALIIISPSYLILKLHK